MNATTPDTKLTVGGQCPVQGYAHVRGHLVYFRARGDWALHVWPPGEWKNTGKGPAADVDVMAASDGPWSEAIVVGEDFENHDEFPAWPHPKARHTPPGSMWTFDADYPGWWTHEYALMVFEWSVALAVPRGES